MFGVWSYVWVGFGECFIRYGVLECNRYIFMSFLGGGVGSM